MYSRPGCHHCEDMKGVVERVARLHEIALREIDISGNVELERAYAEQIPVLKLDGRKVAKYGIRPEELERILGA